MAPVFQLDGFDRDTETARCLRDEFPDASTHTVCRLNSHYKPLPC